MEVLVYNTEIILYFSYEWIIKIIVIWNQIIYAQLSVFFDISIF